MVGATSSEAFLLGNLIDIYAGYFINFHTIDVALAPVEALLY